MNRARIHVLFVSLALALSACDTSNGPILEPDAGQDAGPEPDGGTDAGDTVAPRVIETTPAQGATEVPPSVSIELELSEAMAEDAGTVRVSANGLSVPSALSLDAGGTTLSVSADLPPSARVRVILERDFTDLSGNPMEAPFVLDFTTADDVPPFVTSTTPAEGASGVSARLSAIRVEFSEPMDASAGALALEGGPGELGEPRWALGGIIVPVTGLAYGTSYRVVSSGFTDAAGNALDGTATLGDGALDFTTGPDTDSPRVTDASPSEGQIEVPDVTTTITVVFDEAMDTSVVSAPLSAGDTTTTISGTWSAGGTRIALEVAGRLARHAPHRLDLSAFSDAAGNALDPSPHLGDGALDFVTGVDIFAPYVGFTDPIEGATDVSFRRETIVVVFSEAMDTSITTVEVSDGSSSFTATGTWSLAATRLELDVTNQLWSSRTYTIDFTSFVDAGGTALDTAHPYLADGVLELTLGAPTGESCQDALTVAEATSSSGGGFDWVLAPGAVTTNDGSNTCRGSTTTSVDGVIRYTKTTASASGGGTVLHVRIDSAETTTNAWMALAVLRDVCDPALAGTGSARLRCVTVDNPQHVYLDVGPGDYYVWFSRYSGSDFRGATVRIEEIALPPEGETCAAPYSTSSASAIYSAPASGEDAHVWTIPADAVQAMDHAVAYNGPDAMPCDAGSGGGADTSIGIDALIALPKSSATSIGWLEVEPIHASTELVAELRDRCAGTFASLACAERLRIISGVPRRLETSFTGPVGEYSLWLATDSGYNDFPGAIVRYREIEPAPGDSCANAIPISVGATNAVTPNRPYRLPAPSCFGATEGVTWYRFTTTERFTHVRADAPATIAAIRADDAAELGCRASAAAAPLVTYLAPGTELCVAVASGTPVTSLAVDGFAYSGNLGVPTHLGIERPINPSTGTPRPIIAQTWLSVTPTTLYQGVGTTGVLNAPKAGGTVADFRTDVTTILGSGAVSIGEAIFILDDATGATTPRVHRLVSSEGTWSPVAWDTGSAYPAIRMDAITYDGTSLIYATDWSSTIATTFYSSSPTTPGPGTLLGLTSLVRDVSGIAADATYFYVVARTDATTATEGVYRIARASIGAAPERLALVDVNISRASIVLDDLASPSYLYFRADDGTVQVIADPGGATPRHLGIISAVGTATSETMTLDRASGSLYLFETTTDSSGNFVRLD